MSLSRCKALWTPCFSTLLILKLPSSTALRPGILFQNFVSTGALISTPRMTQTEDKKPKKSRENLEKKSLKLCAVTTKWGNEHISSFVIKICEPNSTYSWHSWGQLSEVTVLSPCCQQQRPRTLELSSAWLRLFPSFCTINTTGEGKRKRRTSARWMS